MLFTKTIFVFEKINSRYNAHLYSMCTPTIVTLHTIDSKSKMLSFFSQHEKHEKIYVIFAEIAYIF